MDIQFRSFLSGHMPVLTDAFIRSIKAITDRRAGLRASLERVGGTKQPNAARSFNLSGSWTSKLGPPGSARYGRRLRQSADLIDRAVAKA